MQRVCQCQARHAAGIEQFVGFQFESILNASVEHVQILCKGVVALGF
jgi:hypothetical protein